MAFALALAALSPTALSAQEAAGRGGPSGVRGVIATLGGEPVPAATVELRSSRDSSAVASTVSSPEGGFRLDSVAAGSYHLLIRHLGFGDVRTDAFTIAPYGLRDLGTIRVDVSALGLEPLVVTVERPDIAFEADRTAYLVEALIAAADGAITDALRAIPELEVDFDGSVRLRGRRPAIYVDGRPAPMEGVSLEMFLAQFPADHIERIEVIENPAARFGAEGSGGIVNIVLKEGAEIGLTGMFSGRAGTRGDRSAGGRATWQRGRWMLSGGVNAGWNERQSSDFSLRQNLLAEPAASFLSRATSTETSSGSLGGMLAVSYEAAERVRLSLRLDGDASDSDRLSVTETLHMDDERTPTLRYDRISTGGTDAGSRSMAVGLELMLDPRRHGLEIDAHARWNDDGNVVRDEIEADPAYEDAPGLPPRLVRRRDERRGDGLGLAARYERPLGERGSLDLGVSIEEDAEGEEHVTSRFDTGGGAPDSLVLGVGFHTGTVRSAFLSVQWRIGELGVQAGLRGEVARDVYELPAGGVLRRGETNVFPSANLSWSRESGPRFRLGYSQRVQRPGLGVIDPTDRSTDPLSRLVGNPDIESSTSHSLTATLSWSRPWGTVSLGPYWNRSTDEWERITTADEGGVSTTTWANVGSRTHLGTALTVSVRRLAGFSGFASLRAARSIVGGSAVTGGLQDAGLDWSVRASLFGKLAGPLSAQGMFGYAPPRNLAQGRTSGQWTADFGLRLRLLSERASVGLSFRDPFVLLETSREIRDPSVLESERSSISSRSVSLSVSYGFGGSGGGRGPRG